MILLLLAPVVLIGKKSAVRLLLINVTVMNDPENGLVLSQELPLICRFCHERVV